MCGKVGAEKQHRCKSTPTPDPQVLVTPQVSSSLLVPSKTTALQPLHITLIGF